MSLAEFQHGVLGVARSAGRLGVPVYAVRHERKEPATRSRYIRDGFEMADGASAEEWLDTVMRFGDRLGRAVLVPIDDLASVFVADHRERLSERFLTADQPAELVRRLSSKRELWELCQQLGLPAPKATFPRDRQELLESVQELGYPAVLKRSDPWLAPRERRAPSVLIAKTQNQLLDGFERMESPVRPQMMLQEYLPGGSDSVWMFNGYFDESSDCLCAFTGRKLRQYRPNVGPTSLGVCEPNDEVASAAVRLMQGIDYRGIVDMGFRYDARDGLYKLLDVNPRIGSTFRLFVADTELDVLRAQYLDLTGQQVPDYRERSGRKWIVEPTDFASVTQLVRERQLSPGSWLRSLRGIDEAAWWAADDPIPFVAMLGRLVPYSYQIARGNHAIALADQPPSPAVTRA